MNGEVVAYLVHDKYDESFELLVSSKSDPRIAEMHTPVFEPLIKQKDNHESLT